MRKKVIDTLNRNFHAIEETLVIMDRRIKKLEQEGKNMAKEEKEIDEEKQLIIGDLTRKEAAFLGVLQGILTELQAIREHLIKQ